jgi:hypothetical protein
MNTKTNNMNNQFNLNQLRSDASQYLAAQVISPIYNDREFWMTDLQDQDQINPNKFEFLTNVMVAHLIGSDYYAVMNRNPLTTIRFDFRGSHQVLNMDAYKWASSEDII